MPKLALCLMELAYLAVLWVRIVSPRRSMSSANISRILPSQRTSAIGLPFGTVPHPQHLDNSTCGDPDYLFARFHGLKGNGIPAQAVQRTAQHQKLRLESQS